MSGLKSENFNGRSAVLAELAHCWYCLPDHLTTVDFLVLWTRSGYSEVTSQGGRARSLSSSEVAACLVSALRVQELTVHRGGVPPL